MEFCNSMGSGQDETILQLVGLGHAKSIMGPKLKPKLKFKSISIIMNNPKSSKAQM